MLGKLFGGGKQQSSSTSTSEPWSKQIPFITRAFDEAGSIYDSQKGSSWYQGPLYAALNSTQMQGINATTDWATGQGADLANATSQAAMQGLGANDNYIQGAMRLLGSDPTQSNIAAAGQYAANPYADGLIDSALRDVSRNLNEQQLPALNRQASLSGNTNSSRTGVTEGILRRGAEDRAADIAAGVRSSLYDKGLSMAESGRQFNQGMGLDALGSAARMGYAGAGMGSQLGFNNADAITQAGGLMQQDQQQQYNADLMRWQQEDQRPWDLLGKYYGIIGANNWGGTTTGTQTTTSGGPGLLGGALGLASAGMGLYTGGIQAGLWGSGLPGFGMAGAGAAGGAGGLAGMASLASMFSDKNLKEDIKKVGELDNGLNVYSYRYKAGGPKHIGVMAQEVEKIKPEAVGEVGGFKTVNYGML